MYSNFSKNLTKMRLETLDASFAVKNFGVDLKYETSEAFAAVRTGIKEFQEKEEITMRRIYAMRRAGFAGEKEGVLDLWTANIIASKALGLNAEAVANFGKHLKINYSQDLPASISTMKKLSEATGKYKVTNETSINTMLDLLGSTQDFGVTLGELENEFEKAEKAGLSYRQAERQARALTEGPRRMGVGQQAFLAQKMGYRGDPFELAAKIRFAQQKMAKGEFDEVGEKMMRTIKEMALKGVAPGTLSREGEAVRIGEFAKMFDVSREVAETWALGGKMMQQQSESMSGNTDEQKKSAIYLADLADTVSKSRTGFEKLNSTIEATKKLFADLFKGGGVVVGDIQERAFRMQQQPINITQQINLEMEGESISTKVKEIIQEEKEGLKLDIKTPSIR
jgi:hypothetical protein